MQVPDLIERAKDRVPEKSYTGLAKALGVPFQHVSNWKQQARPCPADIRARMAAMAGLNPLRELMAAVAEGLSEERKKGLLEALGTLAERESSPPSD